MNWTEEQLAAIKESGKNIIVSAGAGSGKTAVLSERVIEKIKQGIHINELLIMTFTNAAAAEMKERIRKKLLKEKNFKEEIELLDSAYITTFDSFALSIVKKYHDILNITNKVKICDEALITIKKKELLDEIFDEYYEKEDESFLNLIKDFCLKDDKELKKYIISIYNSISLKYDPIEFLEKESINNFKEENLNKVVTDYNNLLKENIKEIENILRKLSLTFSSDYMMKLYAPLDKLLNANNYEEIKNSLDIKLPPVPKNTELEIKDLKGNIKTITDDLKKMCIYSSTEEIKEDILSTKNNTIVITNILKELFKRLDVYKKEESFYNFNDIFHMAIKIVKDNKEIRDEVRNSFKEILVDEYQDTSDLQEYFISLIEDNNVYMVGDVKQSIYRFRNANPYIFKNKYDNYSKDNGGIKIDLNKNFRSRREVLSNINLIFDKIMSDNIGGASYKQTHRMQFGNKTYEEDGLTKQNYNLKIKTYEKEKNISNSIKESFIIATDIKEKIKNKYKIYDGNLREIKYSDFSILLDRSKDFDLYKKVLDYFGIPSEIIKNEELTKEDDILVLKNLFKLIILIHNKTYNQEFKYSFLSVGRSFLFDLDDDILFSYFVNNNFEESDIFIKCQEISKDLDIKTPSMVLEEIMNTFNYEEKLITLINIKNLRTRIEYIMTFLKDFSYLGNTPEDFIEYLDTVFTSSLRIEFQTKNTNSNAVKIMTIHTSKGLEFPICYFAGFTNSFNLRDLTDKILYNNTYGIVLPKVDEVIKATILNELLKYNTKKEEISEKIRLLYVALTRAKEEMIIVCPTFEKDIELSEYTQMKYKSFYNIIESIRYELEDYIEFIDIEVNKDFLTTSFKSDLKLKEVEDFIVEELDIPTEEEEEKRFSKTTLEIQTKEEKEKLQTGTNFHQILEMIDFKNPNLEILDEKEKNMITSFLENDIIKNNLDGNIYHEYEFLFKKENINYHGIIDLMIEKSDKIIIIDYKLKNIDDEKYKDQLNGYKEAIKTKTNKKINTYLYSIIDNKFKEV